jgi:hypothetical protein
MPLARTQANSTPWLIAGLPAGLLAHAIDFPAHSIVEGGLNVSARTLKIGGAIRPWERRFCVYTARSG